MTLDSAQVNAVSSVITSAITSGLVAALVTGVFQLAVTHLGGRYSRRQYFDSRKVDEYFKAMDACAALTERLNDLGMAMTGRKDPDDCEDSAQKQEMIERDKRGAEAIEAAFVALGNASRAATRLELLGSKRAIADFNRIKKVFDDYAEEVVREAQSDRIFRARKFNTMMEDMNKGIACLIANAKVDLGL